MKKTSEILWQDAQHQVLFEIIDSLQHEQFETRILERLDHYMENHFALEETYMRELSYPDTQEHVSAHDKFRMELRLIRQNVHLDNIEVRQMPSTFLRQWLTLHIFGIDKELEQFILESDRK